MTFLLIVLHLRRAYVSTSVAERRQLCNESHFIEDVLDTELGYPCDMALKLSTVAEYFLISLVLYFLVLSPLLQPYLGFSPGNDEDHAATVESYEKIDTLVYPDANLECPQHAYQTHILSRDPLIIYIPSFLTYEESDELVSLGAPHFEPSTVWHAGSESHDPSIRNSSKALLPRTKMVQCVEARARDFQGWRKDVYIERLWAQQYGAGGHYVHHFDWSSAGKGGTGRVSTFMVYLHAECHGGGTNFPRLAMPDSEKWCNFLECDSSHEGITFRAKKGSAVYWENFKADGSGHERTFHAGLPVESGTKIGLNIWSWHQPGHRQPIQ